MGVPNTTWKKKIQLVPNKLNKKTRLYGFWSETRKRELQRYWEAGLSDDEISALMLRTARGIACQRATMGLICDRTRPQCSVIEPLAPVWFPKFEDITKEEARAITATAPPSGKIQITASASYMGTAAAMCAGP